MGLEALLQRGDVWRGGDHVPAGTYHPTGHDALDELLGGGWCHGALTELLLPQPGVGEITLLLPFLANLPTGRAWQAWVAPPHLPYAPALSGAGIDTGRLLWIRPGDATGALWAQEQCLRSGICGAVLAWPRAPSGKALRRLQLAAEDGEAVGFLFRETGAARQSSPAATRLRLKSTPTGLVVERIKQRGGRGHERIRLDAVA